MAKLGDICEIVSGSTPKTDIEDNWNGNLRWITPSELSDKDVIISDTERKISSVGAKNCALTLMPVGTVLLSSRAPIGKVAITGTEMYCNQGFKNLICSSSIYNKYLYYFLKNNTEYLNSLGRGATFKEISKKIVAEIEIPLPSLETQHQIAANLDKVTHTIDLCNAILEKLDLLVKSRFVEMFGNDLPKFDAIPLKDCCAEITGGGTPSMKHPEYYGGNIPFIKSGDVKEDRVSKGALTLTDVALKETTAKLLPKDTIIVVVRSAALLHEFHIAVSDNPIVINQDLKAIKPKDQFIPIYLMWAIKMKERIILGKVQTMLTSHIRMDDFLYLEIPVPPLALQNQFAAFVEQTDKSKLAVKQVLQKAETLKKALMQKYFG